MADEYSERETTNRSPPPEIEAFIRLIRAAPHLAPEFERIAAYVQGKGFGAATIEQEVGFALHLLKTPPLLAIDIGGNVGAYTAELRRKYPILEIHIFEPSATNIATLKSRFSGDDHVTLVPLAVADATGTATLFADAPGSALGSLTRRKLDHFGIDFKCAEPVGTIRFEEYWENVLNKRVLDLVKIDVEGHELAVLNGFGAAIAAARVVQFEFGGTQIDTRNFFQDFWYFFEKKDFAIFRITPVGLAQIQRYDETCEYFSTSNYLAVNRRAVGDL